MFLSLLFASPMAAVAWLLAVLLALTVHEFSHAYVGFRLGDRTAERDGRLTLNPLAHIDPVGFLALVFLGFGWAKPVPYTPYNLRDPKWDSVKIALAGPLSNIATAAVCAFLIRVLVGTQVITNLNLLVVFLFLSLIINLFLAFFNFLPLPPLDGSKLLIALFDGPQYAGMRNFIFMYGPQILTIAVLVSIVSPINPFAFISAPAYATCSALLSEDCRGFFAAMLMVL